RFTIFDQLAILQNPVDEINLSRVAKFERIENSAGLSVTWDLDRLVLFGGFIHYNFYSIDSQFDFLNRAEEQIFLSGNLKLSDVLTVGVRGTFASVNYSQNFQNNSSNYSAGAFADAQVTRYLIVAVEAGYQTAHFSGGGLNIDTSQLSSPYARLRLDHRLNQYLTGILLVGYEAQLGFTTNFTQLTFVRYSADWRMNSRTTVSLNALYEHGLDSSGTVQVENINRFGFGVAIRYALGRKVALNFSYGFIDRQSDLGGHSYRQNQATLGISYAF
ncbi:MAG: outer membrane beta-barrel protein, partial [Verrucomicrobia bacterium]|nr:outer membrane beta-barrel protein [Verrucomicrobiota bacterium]